MWGRKKEWSPEDLLARQLAMNAQTWEALHAHGVDEGTKIRLDFFFNAPDPTAADRLASFLRAETDYDVGANKQSVTGSTQPTSVNKQILDEWVEWMVLAGHENGRCEFDGWGAAVP